MKYERHTSTLRERRKKMTESLTFGRTAAELQKREQKYMRHSKNGLQAENKQFQAQVSKTTQD